MRPRISAFGVGLWLCLCGAAFGQRPPLPQPVAVAQVAPSPWSHPSIDPARRQSVMAKLPARVKERLDRPVGDTATLDFLAARARAYRVGAIAAPLVIDRGAVVDLSADVAGEGRFAANVDLDKSPALLGSIKQSTGADPTKAHVVAVLASHIAPSKRGPEYRDTLLVSVVPKDMSRVSLWRVEGGTYKRVYDGPTVGQAKASGTLRAQPIGAITSSSSLGASLSAPSAIGTGQGDAFSGLDIAVQRDLGATCHGDAGCKSNACALESGAGSPTMGAAAGKCVPASGSGATGDFCTKSDQCQSGQCAAGKCAAPQEKKGLGQPCTSNSGCLSDRCTTRVCVPNGDGEIGQFCNHGPQCKTGTCTANKCASPTYTAYGTFLCPQYCSSSACQGCCVSWYVAETNLILAGAIACHSAASIFWFLHVACAINEAALFTGASVLMGACSEDCNKSYACPQQMNPRNCP